MDFCCQKSVLARTATPTAPLSTVLGLYACAYGMGLFWGVFSMEGPQLAVLVPPVGAGRTYRHRPNRIENHLLRPSPAGLAEKSLLG